jgi:glycosyltransferase involved in cell wall biosynthesis
MINESKIRVLALADYACTTGFATVSSNIMRQLNSTGKYDIDVVAINYTGDPYDHDLFPGRVYPALNIANMNTGDPYGRQKFLDMAGNGEYDVIFIIQDTFIVQTFIEALVETQSILPHKFKIVYYFPIDATPKPEWVTKCVSLVDYPVVYTEYGKKLVLDIDPSLEHRLGVIYHGTNLTDFRYIENRDEVTEFRHNYFSGKADGKFLITNVNRNQIRKDPMRNFMILDELRKRGHNNAILYLHMSHDDAGGNLLVMADQFGFKLQEDFILPSPKFFNANQGIPVESLNMIYNASDALLTPTLGEGWGLSITEAMATRVPIVAPNNTSIIEILDNNRGYLTKSGDNSSMWVMLGGQDNERMRPLMDVEDAASNLEKIMRGQLPDIDSAYEFAHKYNWTDITQQWETIFDKAASEARIATRVGVAQPNREQRRKLKTKGRK